MNTYYVLMYQLDGHFSTSVAGSERIWKVTRKIYIYDKISLTYHMPGG